MFRKHIALFSLLLLAVLFSASTSYGYYILVRPQEVTIEPGAAQKFEAQAYDENRVPVRVKEFQWKVVPATLGTITDDGFFVAARKPGRGEVIATAMIGGKRYAGTAHVKVGAPRVSDIVIHVEPERAIVEPGGTKAFKAIAKGPKGVALVWKSIRWTVEPKNLGHINQHGVFTANDKLGAGKVMALVEIDHQVYVGSANVIVSPPPSASISGNIVDEFGTPLTGVRMTATRIGMPPFFRKTKSDENGDYVLGKLIPGYYVIHAELKGYVPEFYDNVYYLPEATPVQVAEDDSLTGIDFDLTKGGSISGVVMSSGEEAQPLKDAHVWAALAVMPEHRIHVLTAEDGSYKIEGLHSGAYIVHANLAGYRGEYFDDVRKIEDATLVQVEEPNETADINFDLDMTSAITGVITNEADGTPIAGAIVHVRTLLSERPMRWGHIFTDKTNEDGEFAIQVKPGFYLVEAGAQGFAPEWYDNAEKPTEATPVQVFEDEHTAIEMALAPLGTLSGMVVDQETGEPIIGAKVKAFLEQKRDRRCFKTVTDSSGMYTFPGLPAGDYVVMAWAPEYLVEFWEEADSVKNATLVTVENGAAVEDINFTLLKGAVIRGTVTDAEDGSPIAGAFIVVKRQNGHLKLGTRSAEDGTFEIKGLPSGTYLAAAKARGYYKEWYLEAETKEDATPIEVEAPNAVEGIDFTLAKKEETGAGITGIVIDDSTGLPIEGAHVLVMPLTWARPRHAITGPDGVYEIMGMKPGIYIAVAWAEGYIGEFYDDAHRWFNATPIQVKPNEVTGGIDFGLAPREEGAYMISGVVTDEQGNPVEGALVMAEDEGEIVASTLTEEDGSYELSAMPAGLYKVSASVASFQDSYYNGTSAETAASVAVGGGESVYSASITLSSASTDVGQEGALPTAFSLDQNYPNPFNPTTEISFALPKDAEVKLTIYNILGKEVKTLYAGKKSAGIYTLTWDGTNDLGVKLSSGVYIYRLEAKANGERFVQTRRMLMLK